MTKQPETQGPPQLIWVISRRNGIQYGEKPRYLKPKRIKIKKAAA